MTDMAATINNFWDKKLTSSASCLACHSESETLYCPQTLLIYAVPRPSYWARPMGVELAVLGNIDTSLCYLDREHETNTSDSPILYEDLLNRYIYQNLPQ